MANVSAGLGKRLEADLAKRWRLADGQISRFLSEVGLTGEEHNQALYIIPKPARNIEQRIEELRVATADEGNWCFLGGKAHSKEIVIAWPVADCVTSKQVLLALYVEVHSRLVSWWLTNAWRSEQLARATWKLADSDQIVSAAACARSLLETAAAFWVDARKLSEAWRAVKADTAENGPKLKHWQDLTMHIWLMMWGAKFDDKVPDLARAYKLLPRTNVLGLIEKLQRATDDTVQRDYQWLCNAVHPSIGGMLAFATPMMAHDTGTHAFQFVAPLATHIESSRGIIYSEKTIDAAIARSATLAVMVLLETLDVALRIVDDVALTTGAPAMASFTYWRMVSQDARNALCPCRSGRKAKHCPHEWAEEPPRVIEQFIVGNTP
jgi:hypothetical protein